jgi:hypothetical protein
MTMTEDAGSGTNFHPGQMLPFCEKGQNLEGITLNVLIP